MGPTASGKTGVAVELVRDLPCEIVSVDSALVYRGMDIGTAKPDAATLALAPHHLIDLIDPTASYSAAQFCIDALRLMAEITARGNIPLLVGGTMLYFKALLHGLNALPQADANLRAELDEKARRLGWPALHAELARLDPVTAARLEPADAQRIQRALEVCLLSGLAMSALLEHPIESDLPYRIIQIALEPGDRAVLHRRIAERFDAMLAAGLVDEVQRLRLNYPLNPSLPAMRCVGYRQAWQYLDDEFDLATLREKGIAATRQLAKRQLTWLRGMEGLRRFDCLDADLSAQVRDVLRDEFH
ncbi:MAG: tRNA (adenosine(37)-N6)-dimethylallyltransferase MiaA [Sulfuricellaceae bacterium]